MIAFFLLKLLHFSTIQITLLGILQTKTTASNVSEYGPEKTPYLDTFPVLNAIILLSLDSDMTLQ